MSIETVFFLKTFLIIALIITLFAIIRNLDVVKIILIYFKDKLIGK